MADITDFSNALDSNRARRARELSDLKRKVATFDNDPYQFASKAVIVFAYAHWEGFYNECVEAYLATLRNSDVKATATCWMMLLGNIDSEFDRLASRNHSYDAKIDFIETLQTKLSEKFDQFNERCLLARSNLDFQKLKYNFRVLGCDISPFQSLRNRLDKELVAWRHSIAHGSSPDLDRFAAEGHLNLASRLMLNLSDSFQTKMLSVQSA